MLTTSLLIVCGLAAPIPSSAAKKAQDALQGNWIAVAFEEKGHKLTAKETEEENFAITVQGNELSLGQGGAKPNRFTFTLDPSKTPAHIDLTSSDGKGKPGTVHAIYSLEKGELKICFVNNRNPNEPETRPQEFETSEESKNRPPKGKVMYTFKKEAK